MEPRAFREIWDIYRHTALRNRCLGESSNSHPRCGIVSVYGGICSRLNRLKECSQNVPINIFGVSTLIVYFRFMERMIVLAVKLILVVYYSFLHSLKEERCAAIAFLNTTATSSSYRKASGIVWARYCRIKCKTYRFSASAGDNRSDYIPLLELLVAKLVILGQMTRDVVTKSATLRCEGRDRHKAVTSIDTQGLRNRAERVSGIVFRISVKIFILSIMLIIKALSYHITKKLCLVKIVRVGTICMNQLTKKPLSRHTQSAISCSAIFRSCTVPPEVPVTWVEA